MDKSFGRKDRVTCNRMVRENFVRQNCEKDGRRRRLIVVRRTSNLTVVCHFCKRIVCQLNNIYQFTCWFSRCTSNLLCPLQNIFAPSFNLISHLNVSLQHCTLVLHRKDHAPVVKEVSTMWFGCGADDITLGRTVLKHWGSV